MDRVLCLTGRFRPTAEPDLHQPGGTYGLAPWRQGKCGSRFRNRSRHRAGSIWEDQFHKEIEHPNRDIGEKSSIRWLSGELPESPVG